VQLVELSDFATVWNDNISHYVTSFSLVVPDEPMELYSK
jgi:hypothetical protein